MTSQQAVGIGAAARALGTTERALRYYEQRGLLSASSTSTGGHRRYDDDALARARQVLALRRLGLPVDAVAELVDGRGDTRMVLVEQRDRLDAQRRELSALRDRIAALIDDGGTPHGAALNLLEELAMNVVLTDIYTRAGDDGSTALGGGVRVDKTDARLEAMGDVDELVSALGVALAASSDELRRTALRGIQNDLFDLGADLAAAGDETRAPLVDADYVRRLEGACDRANADLEPPASFVLPGADAVSAALHVARAVCRRAERHAWAAVGGGEGPRYLNRLSDLLFVLARAAEDGREPTWAAGTHRPTAG